MIETVKPVGNPLTIIAIFAALAEVAGTVALATVDTQTQSTFVWFVIGFPTLLVILFFLTLNFNPGVLYAPKNFRNEENFVRALIGTRKLSLNLQEATEQLRQAKEEILKEAIAQITEAGGTEQVKFAETLDRQLRRIEVTLDAARATAELAASDATSAAASQSELRARILSFLGMQSEPKSALDIAKHTQAGYLATERALSELAERGLVLEHNSLSDPEYSLRIPVTEGGLGGTL